MTNTLASVRIIARCSFCTRRFTVTNSYRNESGGLSLTCDDLDDHLCCDDCLCAHCGHGHVTETDAALCEGDALYPAGEVSDFDYDAWSDAVRHQLTER